MSVFIAEKMTDYVECSCCKARYHQVFVLPSQASGCASAAYIKKEDDKYFIYCHYPSQFDTDRYVIHDKVLIEQLETESNVCDNCIQKYSVIGDIIKDEQFDFWGEMNASLDAHIGVEEHQRMQELFDNTPEDDSF